MKKSLLRITSIETISLETLVPDITAKYFGKAENLEIHLLAVCIY